MLTLAAFGNLGMWEIVGLALLALLIFGKRLPEVGRSLGKGLVEFKKGLSGIEDDVKSAGQIPDQASSSVKDGNKEA